MTDDIVILVCALVKGPLLIPDNKVGHCDVCGFEVEYRPHAPRNAILRCIACAFDMLGPEDNVGTTPRMVEDAKAYFKKKRN